MIFLFSRQRPKEKDQLGGGKLIASRIKKEELIFIIYKQFLEIIRKKSNNPPVTWASGCRRKIPTALNQGRAPQGR